MKQDLSGFLDILLNIKNIISLCNECVKHASRQSAQKIVAEEGR
jgi:hypothetical protein